MGFGEFPDNNNNNTEPGSTTNSVASAVNSFIAANRAVNVEQRKLDEIENNKLLRNGLTQSSFSIDTVFGYNFEYHDDPLNDNSLQVLHPYLTNASTAFGGSLASLLHGRITLPREESGAKSENAQWLIFGHNRGLYCISLTELRNKDNIWGIEETANISDVNAKLDQFGITRYGWASNEKKDKLIPHTYVTYVDALLASLFSLPFYLLPAPYNLFGFMFTMGIFFYRLHPQLEAIQYQQHKEGRRPSIGQTDIIWRDGVTVGLQTGLAATLTTFMMNIELHNAIGFDMSDAMSCMIPSILPWCATLTLSLVTGLALGAALFGIAKASQNKDNPYTNAQLARVFFAGFCAGALIYPLLMLSSKTSQPLMCTLVFEYIINISLGAALHVNVRDRLQVGTQKPVLLSSKNQENNASKQTQSKLIVALTNVVS